uniref:Uncharacterized protein n=1 Tax=Ditylenchus dipsaci TaxID=166011 RepID=A0A915END7_9BILA
MQDYQLRKLQREIAQETDFLKQHHIEPQESSETFDLPVFSELKRLDIKSKLHILQQSRKNPAYKADRHRRECPKALLSKIQKELHTEGSKSRRLSSRRYSIRNPSPKPAVKKKQTSIASSESEQKEPPSSAGYYSSDDRSSRVVSVPETANEKSQTTSFRLDFSALDSSPERRKKTLKHKQWTDLEIYPRELEISEVEQPKNPALTSKSKSSGPSKIQPKDSFKYPDWLRLLPDQLESSSRSEKNGLKSEPRLLYLPEGAEEMWKRYGVDLFYDSFLLKCFSGFMKSKSRSAREKVSAEVPEKGMTRHDSGFIDHQTGQSARKIVNQTKMKMVLRKMVEAFCFHVKCLNNK